MKKWSIVVTVVLISVLQCSSVFADSIRFTNSDSSNGDKPAKGVLEAYKIEKKLLATKANIQWTSDQIKQFHSDDFAKQFFPALIFSADQSDQLRSKLMFTNLPGAKFTRNEASEITGEEIKVSTMNTSKIVADKPYDFYTAWLNKGSGNAVVTLQSLQGYAQPNGTLNELPKTNDILSTIDLDQAKTSDKKYRDLHMPESVDSPSNQYSRYDSIKGKVKSYSTINSKEALNEYKVNAAKLVQAVSDDEEVQFAITFKKPIVVSSLDRIVQDYDLSISQIYAAGYALNSQGNIDKSDEFTISWFDIKNNELMALMNIGSSLRFGEFIVTELEGKARGIDLNRISKLSEVDVVDIEENGARATGIHWLNSRYAK